MFRVGNLVSVVLLSFFLTGCNFNQPTITNPRGEDLRESRDEVSKDLANFFDDALFWFEVWWN